MYLYIYIYICIYICELLYALFLNLLMPTCQRSMASLMRKALRNTSHTFAFHYNQPSVSLICQRLSSSLNSQEALIDDSQPVDRSCETPDVTRARLLYQSRKRGILETDLLLSTFAHKHLPTMSNIEMHEYDKVQMSLPESNLTSTVTRRTGLGDILLANTKETSPY